VENWPPYSPDLNVIENLWAILAGRVSKWCRDDAKDTSDELWEIVKTEAREIDAEILTNLVEDFLERLQFSADVEGDWAQH